MFISANEASKMTWEARHITNFGEFCKLVNNEIEVAAKKGYIDVSITSSRISALTPQERDCITTRLKLLGYRVKWKLKGEDNDLVHIMWEVEE